MICKCVRQPFLGLLLGILSYKTPYLIEKWVCNTFVMLFSVLLQRTYELTKI